MKPQTSATLPRHTPGEWLVVSDGPAAKLFDATVIVSEHIDDAIICSIGGDVPEAEANARLIAAAPEMYAFLVALESDDYVEQDRLNVILRKARGTE